MDVVGCSVYLKEFCEEDLLTKDNLKTSLCFVFYLSFERLRCIVRTHERSQKEIKYFVTSLMRLKYFWDQIFLSLAAVDFNLII